LWHTQHTSIRKQNGKALLASILPIRLPNQVDIIKISDFIQHATEEDQHSLHSIVFSDLPPSRERVEWYQGILLQIASMIPRLNRFA